MEISPEVTAFVAHLESVAKTARHPEDLSECRRELAAIETLKKANPFTLTPHEIILLPSDSVTLVYKFPNSHDFYIGFALTNTGFQLIPMVKDEERGYVEIHRVDDTFIP